MKKVFQEMYDSPEPRTLIATAFYWILAFAVFPDFVFVAISGLFNQLTYVGWCEISYFLLNFIIVLCMHRHYLANAFWNVRLDLRGFATTVGLAVVLILFYCLLPAAIHPNYITVLLFQALPMTENTVLIDPAWLVVNNPLFGTLTYTLLTPLTVSCLFYNLAFAPVSINHPRLAYPVMLLVCAIPSIFTAVWRDMYGYMLLHYLIRLPIHLIACWTYQKTDTVWAPIATHSIVNLLVCIALLVLRSVGYFSPI